MRSVRTAQLLFTLFAGTAAAPTFAGAEDSAERGASLLAEAQVRIFAKAVEVCASLEEPGAKSVDLLFDRYRGAFYSGTKAGLLEMYKTESTSQPSEPYDPRDIDVQLQQGEQNAQAMRASGAACKKLEAHLASGTAAAFKQLILDGHREYLDKRRTYCARSPKPKNCE